MRCPKCDANVNDTSAVCGFCGQDLSIIHYVRRISNTYYNMGLEKAKVRDLSGAVVILKKSLQFNKKNTDARNLLGLVYYEMGETVAALSEWVLSKYLQPEENLADYYINTIQKNQTALDATNQTIKKYNAALAAAKGGLGLVAARDVAEAHLVAFLVKLAGLRLAEAERSATAARTALHAAHEEDPHADEKDHREPGDEDRSQQAWFFRRFTDNLDVLGQQVIQ